MGQRQCAFYYDRMHGQCQRNVIGNKDFCSVHMCNGDQSCHNSVAGKTEFHISGIGERIQVLEVQWCNRHVAEFLSQNGKSFSNLL